MRIFHCQRCGQMLFFANTSCERCGLRLGYLPDRTVLSALVPLDGDRWRPLADAGRPHRFCVNAGHDACNWLVPADGPERFCRACRLNRTIPDLDRPQNHQRWQRLETAKHRLVYGLLRLGLPLTSRFDDPRAGLAFDFLADARVPVTTGHRAGVITIDIAEADDAERERHRLDMAETYRTLLGHFRHEVGHYYWDRLVRDGLWLEAFRTLFGDERRDYAASVTMHYETGPPADWRQRYISGYASAHPWEDFAETWAHYLHIVDTLETAHAFGLQVHPQAGSHSRPSMTAIDFDPYRQADFDLLIRTWLPLTYAVNSLNHSMGLPDLYAFVLAPTVMGKLRFVHGLIGR
ncbi:putative zinc-binding peptidase [Azospirillum sp. RWY-5-1]|uniref:Zinc-binding peptidase n=1 Tax=Azospirillum oleiclasticum TaxID=2735135 RepID=A0ABX2T3A3_9PROT|nr:putative zinc-binding peptidase [Azospirillum oleiclasticum]NYZ11455.1 putative zinc-binding peptidase [Azospirillum oleiclasticum]NYZ18616.1 putative zinc-binding peptidase [Azospirillum oleiclasticum]